MIKANSGKSGAVRVNTLDATDLANAERHGLREDASGQARKVSDDEPLVRGGLNIVERCDVHRQGAKQQGKTKAMHALLQFPSELVPNDQRHQRGMVLFAEKFINDFYGGNAVFASRLDRDEKGTHKVDVFFLPTWEFEYKDGRKQKRCGIGQFTKNEAKKRYDKTDRRAQGSSLQDAFYEFMRDEMHVQGVMRPEKKKSTVKDQLEPESFGLKRDAERLALQRLEDESNANDAQQLIVLANRQLKRVEMAQKAERAELDEIANTVEKQTRILIAAKLSENKPVSEELRWSEIQSKKQGRDRVR